MPQINRIRVNNVKYNFGTQFYDDFVMRFSCKNTIYDLANGGGKSVLMLLLLQNLIPNCTLDDKQPIEKLFRNATGSTTIHSLIEWKLDPCYMKDNFKYMTTGFCARRAKDTGEGESTKETANIEYFNYCIFYREFGDNDIRNLPLSNGKERITYQGLKNYLKDLEKKDFGVSVKIFDRKNEYQQFITGYGIFESQWEIIRGINKTEGHVRTYFETNYKTGRKVVEDLLIEQIIEKSFANRIGIAAGDADMAKTLLDIKDKLIELSGKKETLDNYDRQIEAMEKFSEKLSGFEDIYTKKQVLRDNLTKSYLAVKSILSEKESRVQALEEEKENLVAKKMEISKDIAIGNILEDEASLKELKGYLEQSEEKLNRLLESRGEYIELLNLKEVAMHYNNYLEYKYKKEEIRQTIDNRLRDFEDIRKDLNTLASKMQGIYKKEKEELSELLKDTTNRLVNKKDEFEGINKQIREYDRSIAVNTKLLAEYEAKQEEILGELKTHMQNVSLLVAEDLEGLLSDARKKLSDSVHEENRLKNLIAEYKEKISRTQSEEIAIDYKLELVSKEIEKKENALLSLKEKTKKVEKLCDVYSESGSKGLFTRLEGMVKSGIFEQSEVESKISRLSYMKNCLLAGEYSFEEPQYKEIKDYLFENYGEDVVTGDVWLKQQPIATRRDLLKRVPFITHSIVVKDDFERIKADINLRNISRGAYVVPIVGEGVLYETRNAITSDCILFAFKDLSFLGEEDKIKLEISKLEEELVILETNLSKITDRLDVIREDYAFVLEYAKTDEPYIKNLTQEVTYLEKEKENEAARRETLISNKEVYNTKLLTLEKEWEDVCEKVKAQEETLNAYSMIAKNKSILKSTEEKLVECKRALSSGEKDYERSENDLAACEKIILELTGEKEKVSEKLATLEMEWNSIYQPYFTGETLEAFENRDELKAKFLGLKAIIDKDASDVSDKEQLFAAFDSSANKEISEIEYLGFSLEQAQVLYNDNKLTFNDRSELLTLKQEKAKVDGKISDIQNDILSQSALVNRTEGSVSHAKKELLEKYGQTEYPQVDNIALYKEEKKNALRSVDGDIKSADGKIKEEKDNYTKTFIINKDLERVIKNAGIDIDENEYGKFDSTDFEFDEEGYEKTAADFNRVLKEEAKKKEEFYKNRQHLKESLEGLGAYELAFEVNASIEAPTDLELVREIKNNIAETNKCIKLEKARVGKGIEDMQRIKDSFENRCLQTCDNIKAELDRLPKLSKITLDNEVISIIGLSIPYIKDEFKKEKMSSYIQEIIVGSESFKNPEERLKYIKSKLTWKKLFSVIVTDMNSIKLNLYKRERISGQSRYLRYEEAVGSTGQSQGIYIQFLIAIINYISSINAAGKAEGVVGKTIFIDNPFGAAKDTYIWEPIFKLLKTNHVQLIVPARGTTPAIVGKFEVNYILGQKMVNGMQQTVVVDYRSETVAEGLEYERLEFSQATLDFGQNSQ